VRILVAESLAAEGLALLRARHDVDERLGLKPAELQAIVGDYEGLVVRSQVQVDAAVIAAGHRLMVIGRAGVGVDNVDVEAATRAGITVVNAPTGNTIAAAEHTLALMLGLARHLAPADASMRRGEWTRSKFVGRELRGRTLGIVGFGKIGQAVANRARGLEMTVVASDPFLTAEGAAAAGVELLDLPQLLASADIVSLHVPLTRSTTDLIGASELALMRRGAILLNVSRGGVVDEAALADALRSGHLAGAGIDVFEHEPPTGSPLLEAPNTLLTPHLGASTAEAQLRVAIEAAEQVLLVLDGQPAAAAVNAPLVSTEAAETLAPYLALATMLGEVLRQVSGRGIGELTVELGGELARHDAAPVVAAVLLGLLEPTGERINLVNARALARARGIRVAQRSTPDSGPYNALLTVSTPTDRAWSPTHDRPADAASGSTASPGAWAEMELVAGTVAYGQPRLTRLGPYDIDLEPAPRMLVTRHHDRPGTMGRIGLLLGNAGINVGAVHLARSSPHGEALMILGLDDDVPPTVAAEVQEDESVLGLWLIRLGPPS
jgi:D-3-phosphoglycerate dehydrogenase / 2-oxoglutarate reductase